eukprot:1088999-Prymnesium_polylepis.1
MEPLISPCRSASSPAAAEVGASGRVACCVQQAAVALTSRQQRRSSTMSPTLLTRLGDECYASLGHAEYSVHCMARCRRPTSLALSSS